MQITKVNPVNLTWTDYQFEITGSDKERFRTIPDLKIILSVKLRKKRILLKGWVNWEYNGEWKLYFQPYNVQKAMKVVPNYQEV